MKKCIKRIDSVLSSFVYINQSIEVKILNSLLPLPSDHTNFFRRNGVLFFKRNDIEQVVSNKDVLVITFVDDVRIYSKLEFNLKYEYIKEFSDGYHTFGELYDYRLAYNALLFNTWAKMKPELKGKDVPGGVFGGEITITAVNGPPLYDVHKSWKHNDGEWCFGTEKEYFIVVAILPTGQITNHYKAEHWDKFQIPESPKAKYPYDGHTPKDALQRMNKLLNYEMDKSI